MKARALSFASAKWVATIIVCLIMAMACTLPSAAQAEESVKTVRVGWYESPFNMTDEYGRRSGYAYDYQEKIAAYANWNYEYVEGSWPELMQMLIDGKIDLMSDVSYTSERAENMFFSSIPMGAEEYYLFVAAGNTEYTPGSYTYFNGKKVGVNKGSVQLDYFLEWEKMYGVESELVELTCSQEEANQMLESGELDAYVVPDAFGGVGTSVPVVKVGSSDFFFAVNKARPDLRDELNVAMSRIQDENRFYDQQLFEKYGRTSGANLFLPEEEKSWLADHGVIRVGYQDNHLSFCATDKETGELTGALRDYLDIAADCFENAHLDFETVAYPTSGAAMEALEKGEVDCMFPCNFSASDGEAAGLLMTPAATSTEIYALVQKADQSSFLQKEQATVAIEQDDPNYGTIIMDKFPGWQTMECSDLEACMSAVEKGQADCVLISNYQYNNIAQQCEAHHLIPLATGENADYYFAVNEGNKELYSILTRTTGIVSDTAINAALTSYSTQDAKTSLLDFIKENPFVAIAVIAVVIALLAVIVAQRRIIRVKRRADESEHRADELGKRVYVDALTSVKNKGAFDEHAHDLQSRLDGGESVEFAIGVFDCDDLKTVNDQYGHDKGDEYIKSAAKLICRTFKHSPVFRVGGDEFIVILQDEDYRNRDDLANQFRQSRASSEAAGESWEQARVSMGIAVFDPSVDASLNDAMRRADKAIYEQKRLRKESQAS